MPLVNEYIERLRLAKLGYFSPLDDLSIEKAESFLIIDAEIDKLNSEKNKVKRR